jgi:hypothetical protein
MTLPEIAKLSPESLGHDCLSRVAWHSDFPAPPDSTLHGRRLHDLPLLSFAVDTFLWSFLSNYSFTSIGHISNSFPPFSIDGHIAP